MTGNQPYQAHHQLKILRETTTKIATTEDYSSFNAGEVLLLLLWLLLTNISLSYLFSESHSNRIRAILVAIFLFAGN